MGRIVKISGPLVEAVDITGARLFDVVRLGKLKLTGEIIEMRKNKASIEVYEETSLLQIGEEVESTYEPLSVELAPGLIEGIFDGIARPLDKIASLYGNFITRGINVDMLDRKKLWHFYPTVKVGDEVNEGDEIGYVDETVSIRHKIFLEKGVCGKIKNIKEGDFTIVDTIATLTTDTKDINICMLKKYPIRTPRPILQKLVPFEPMLTGQRVIDTLFPIARGGVCCVPGPFGSGKTIVQHQLAKWADADVIVYIGCGERGNEMTDVLNEFPTLVDPKTNKPLMKRTILIANTSDMPVSAREASIYTGITIAEYFRDMGYNVAVMADSTSRYAEALRELSGRLEEMPGEEGYPAYLSSRLAAFYERAGLVKTLSQKTGSITVVGAVSPPGGDLSEPVTQATLRIVKVFWGLSSNLAYKRHFPAIDWTQSYSLYLDNLKPWYEENVSPKFNRLKQFVSFMLQEENELNEIVRLVGSESLTPKNRLVLETSKMIREDFLHQNAFNEIDTFTSIEKQNKMLDAIYSYYNFCEEGLNKGVEIKKLLNLKTKDDISRMKYIEEENLQKIDNIIKTTKVEIQNLIQEGEKDERI